MSLKAIQEADRRSLVLRFLSEESDYAQNESVIKLGLRGYGHTIPDATLHADLQWLQESALVTLDKIGGLYVATITRRGLDVASGASVVAGVARPRPEV